MAVLVLVFTWGLRPSNWVPKSVSVTSEAAQQPPARAHFVKQTEERRGGTLIIALPILTLTMLHCTTQHLSTRISTVYTLHRDKSFRRGEWGDGDGGGNWSMLSPTNIFQENISRLFTTDGQFTSFQSGRLVWRLARARAGRRFHLVPIVKISSESYYPDFWLGLEPGPVCWYYRASSEGSWNVHNHRETPYSWLNALAL